MKKTNEDLLNEILRGREISAITFVKGYVQIHFDGPYINVYGDPSVVLDATLVTKRSSNYYEVLLGLIGQTVTTIDEGDLLLSVKLADGASLAISLDPATRICAEAAMFQDGTGQNWITW
jgi:hypothetical protein